MITFDEMAVLDVNSEYLGVPTSQLMDNAGEAIAEAIRDADPDGPVVVLCGPGNNGGDGFVAARHLVESGDVDVEVVLAKSAQATKSSLAREALNRLRQVSEVHELGALGEDGLEAMLAECGLVVDAMLGVGLYGELREPYRTIVRMVEAADRPILAVDVPTGLGTDVVLTPDRTVTFHDVKEGMDEETCGPIRVVDIGIPDEAELFVGPGELLTYYPAASPDSHKGQNGRMLVVGGGPYVGAPVLSALAGLRAGCDLSHLFVPETIFDPVASFKPDLIAHPHPGDRLTSDAATGDALDALLDDVDAVVVGPGLGDVEDDTLASLFARLSDHAVRVVVDADAVGFLGRQPDAVASLEGVVTPHLGEFRELVDTEVPEEIGECGEMAAETAARLQMTVLLKGPMDLVTNGKQIKVNRTGNARMTVGGTGDVLAGLVGGLLAKGASPYNAARIGAFVNGYAGDLIFDDMGPSFLASEMLDTVPRVFGEFFDDRGRTIQE